MAKNVSDNNLLARVLEVLSLLVKYGYYDDPDDVDDVLRPLVDVFNGFSDLPFPKAEQGSQNSEGEGGGGRRGEEGGRRGEEGGRREGGGKREGLHAILSLWQVLLSRTSSGSWRTSRPAAGSRRRKRTWPYLKSRREP